LLDGVKSCVAHTVGGVTSNYLGDLYGKGNLPYLLHKGGHVGAGFLLSLGLSEGDIEEAIGGGIAALGAEIGAESLPSSLSREARGNIAKVGGSLAGLLAGAKKGTGIFTACNAIDHNFMWTIPLAARLTPRMLAALGLSGMTAYEVGQWLKDHPMLMDMLPEGIEWEDPGFMPEESKAEVLTTPSHEDKSFILQTPIADLYSLILQTPVYDGPDTSILLKGELPKDIPQGAWIPPQEALDKVPDFLGMGKSAKGEGWRWQTRHGQDGVRIMKGDLTKKHPTQHVDYVKINTDGKLVGLDGKLLSQGSTANLPETHIPLSEWLTWKEWNKK